MAQNPKSFTKHRNNGKYSTESVADLCYSQSFQDINGTHSSVFVFVSQYFFPRPSSSSDFFLKIVVLAHNQFISVSFFF